MKKIFVAVIFFITFFSGANAAVSGLTFTTDPITVSPGEISEGLTVSSGEPVGEVSDLTLSSSSATGEFLNSSGADFKPTWNSNWANRTFYYRDSTTGTFQITATLTTRASRQTWTAFQTITVGNDATPSNGDTSSDGSFGSGDDGSSSGSSSSSRSSTLSSHSSVAELSSFKFSPTLKSSAGRERLTAVNSPITFKALVPDSFKNSKTKFTWVFGDGGSAKSATARHAYEAPGNYQVVLNVVSGEEEAPSRTKVKVFNPDIKLGYNLVGGKLMLALVNRGEDELNIGGWQLSNMGQVFTFPEDTIVAGKAEITLSPGVIGFTPNQLFATQLLYPNVQVATEIAPSNNLNKEEIVKMINELKDRVVKISQ